MLIVGIDGELGGSIVEVEVRKTVVASNPVPVSIAEVMMVVEA